MNAEKEKLLEKLQKLFALSKSDNQHEAELALAKANKLMEDHQIGMTEIDLYDEGGSITENEFVMEGVKPYSKNVLTLGSACAKFYNAECFRIKKRNDSRGVRLRFVGTPTDIAAATATFNYLLNSWKSIANYDLKKSDYSGNAKIFKNSHLYGFSFAIYKRIETLLADRNCRVLATTGRDLVVVKNAALDDYMKNTKVKMSNPTMRNFSNLGYCAGDQSGKNIPLNGAIEQEPVLKIGSM
jgi:hypothetical protein